MKSPLTSLLFAALLIAVIGIPVFASINPAYFKNTKIHIVLYNNTKDTVTVIIESMSNFQQTPSVQINKTIFLTDKIDETFTVPRYSILTAYGLLKKGGKTKPFTILADQEKIDFSQILKTDEIQPENSVSLTNLTNTESLLEFKPSEFLIPNTKPFPIAGLFNQYLGGLVAYIKDTKDSVIILDRIAPTEIGAVMEHIPPGRSSNTETFYFDNQMDQKIKSALPGIVGVNVGFTNQHTYEIKATYEQLGSIDWINEKNINIDNYFVDSLSKNIKFKLGKLKIKYPQLQLKQIDKAYIFDGIYYEVNELKKLSGTDEINGNTFFTSAGNFSRINRSLKKTVIGNSYLGYWSSAIAKDFTTYLEFSKQAFFAFEKKIFDNLNDNNATSVYKQLREELPSLPELNSKKDIVDFFNSSVTAYKETNLVLGTNSLLSTDNPSIGQTINNLSKAELVALYEKNKEMLPELMLPDQIDNKTKRNILEALKTKVPKTQFANNPNIKGDRRPG